MDISLLSLASYVEVSHTTIELDSQAAILKSNDSGRSWRWALVRTLGSLGGTDMEVLQ